MIEPVLAAPDLVIEIAEATPELGSLVLWRLGQAGFLVSFPTARVLIDAYLSNHCEATFGEPFDHRRLTRAPLDPVDLVNLDIVICTHAHLDHFDVPTLRTVARQNEHALALAPSTCSATLLELGWPEERVIVCRDQTEIEINDVTVRSFAVPHEQFDDGPDGSAYLGFILDDGLVSFAHLGDTVAHPQVTAALATPPIDVLAVPINGRDCRRAELGFAGNLTPEEAVRVGADAGAGVVIPMHYDMFAQNAPADSLDLFMQAAASAGVPVQALSPGEHLRWVMPST